jgi:phage shock protein A
VTEARAKIEKLSRMISETELLEAQAELQEMAAGMVGSLGGSGDTLNRVEEYLTERRDKAAGRARVAKGSIDTTDVQLKANEQDALGQQALAEFAASYGLQMPASAAQAAPAAGDAAAPPPVRKELGPGEKN